MSGKGSKQRPGTGYADNWERIFAKPKESHEFDLFWHALNYRGAPIDMAGDQWFELEACVNRLIERGEKV